MKIIKFTASHGDVVLVETDVIEEAERILCDYERHGCGIVDKLGCDVLPLKEPLPDEAFILWPMSGGA